MYHGWRTATFGASLGYQMGGHEVEKRKRIKVQVSLTPELLESLDEYCDAIGVSRSAFVQTTLGQTLYNLGAVQRVAREVFEDTTRQSMQAIER